MTSEAQVESNRANAQQSTGPRTEAGKAASSRNGVTHGMASWDAIPEGRETEAELRVTEWVETFRPQGSWERFVCELGAKQTIRAEVCRASEDQTMLQLRIRAEAMWEVDREAEAAHLGAKLRKNPTEVVALLKKSLAGCSWLMARWAALERAVHDGVELTADECAYALDLFGVEKELRRVTAPRYGLGEKVDMAKFREALAFETRKIMAAFKGPQIDADRHQRAAMMNGTPAFVPAELRLARRYASEAERLAKWARSLLERICQDKEDATTVKVPKSVLKHMSPEVLAAQRAWEIARGVRSPIDAARQGMPTWSQPDDESIEDDDDYDEDEDFEEDEEDEEDASTPETGFASESSGFGWSKFYARAKSKGEARVSTYDRLLKQCAQASKPRPRPESERASGESPVDSGTEV